MAEDPETTEGATDIRPLRGGSWYGGAEELRSTFRFGFDADCRSGIFGFRVAAFLPSQAGGSYKHPEPGRGQSPLSGRK